MILNKNITSTPPSKEIKAGSHVVDQEQDKPLTNGYHDGDEKASRVSHDTDMTTTMSAASPVAINGDISSGTTRHTATSNATIIVDDAELKRLLSAQLEFYFSRENLLHDKYLLSQMDSDSYVSLTILAQFNMIRKLFSNSQRFASIMASLNGMICVIILSAKK